MSPVTNLGCPLNPADNPCAVAGRDEAHHSHEARNGGDVPQEGTPRSAAPSPARPWDEAGLLRRALAGGTRFTSLGKRADGSRDRRALWKKAFFLV